PGAGLPGRRVLRAGGGGPDRPGHPPLHPPPGVLVPPRPPHPLAPRRHPQPPPRRPGRRRRPCGCPVGYPRRYPTGHPQLILGWVGWVGRLGWVGWVAAWLEPLLSVDAVC